MPSWNGKNKMRRILLFSALIIVLSSLLGYLVNLPKDVGQDVPDGKLNSLSFAPFREGHNPLLEQFPSNEEIDQDLQLLADKTHTIRTYASSQGLKDVATMAGKHGLEMIQGAWIGYAEKDNRREIEALVKAANAYPDVIKRVIVGNEVLLRGEQKPEKLVEYIREVKSRVSQPVSYADVWSMYMKYPELIKEVEFITIHILPYWEDEPIPVERAPQHIERIFKQVKAEADKISPGKRILIGESGWPAEGKQRGWAKPSVVNEAAFIRGLLKVAKDNGFDVNIVEAFNQSWKSELEGVVGANWGLFTVDREEVFPLTGKVYENASWFKALAAASIMMLALAFYYAPKLQRLSKTKLLFFLVFLQILSWLWVSQVSYSWTTSYDNWQRLRALLLTLVNLTIVFLASKRAFSLLLGRHGFKWGWLLNTAMVIMIVLALYKTYLLAVEGRYISYPFEFALITLASLFGLFFARCVSRRQVSLFYFDMNRLNGDEKRKPERNSNLGWLTLGFMLCLWSSSIGRFLFAKSTAIDFPEVGDRINYALKATFGNTTLLGLSLYLLTIAGIFFTQGKDRPLGWWVLMTMLALPVGEFSSFYVARDFIQSYPGYGDRIMQGANYTLTNGQLLAWLACLAFLAVALLTKKPLKKNPRYARKS